MRAAIEQCAAYLKECGADVEYFDLGLMEYTIPAYYVIAAAEASSNLERFDGVKYGYRAKEYEGLHDMYKRSRSEGFGPEVKRRIMLGSFVLSSGYYDAYYLKALKVRHHSRTGSSDGSSKDRNFFKRSDEDVFKRYLYGCRKPCRSSGTHSPVQHERKGTTDRCPASR